MKKLALATISSFMFMIPQSFAESASKPVEIQAPETVIMAQPNADERFNLPANAPGELKQLKNTLDSSNQNFVRTQRQIGEMIQKISLTSSATEVQKLNQMLDQYDLQLQKVEQNETQFIDEKERFIDLTQQAKVPELAPDPQ